MINDKIHYVSAQGLQDMRIELGELKDTKIPLSPTL